MDALHIIPFHSYIDQECAVNEENNYSLLYRKNGIEMIRYHFPKGTKGVFDAIDSPENEEIYYVERGELTFRFEREEKKVLHPGDLFILEYGKPQMTFTVEEDTELLLYTNKEVYQKDKKESELVTGIMRKVQEKDGYTNVHCHSVSKLIIEIAREMHYPVDDMNFLMNAAKFHDVGKIKIPTEILCKPGRLTKEEFDVIKMHSTYSAEIIRPVFGEQMAHIILCHHERIDGTGYPNGITGDEIPLESRMLSVADAYDAMTTDRNYNVIRSREEAMEELHRFAGTQFDPACVEAMCRYLLDC